MITLSSSTLDFGEVYKGQVVSKQITVYSTESASVTVDIASSSPDYIVAPLQLVIDAYSSKSFTVQYTANSLINSTGQIIVSSLVSSDQICNVLSTFELPSCIISTTTLAFGQVGINDFKTLTVSIQNTSSDAILTVSPSVDPLYLTNFSFSNFVEIQPNSTILLNVTFNAKTIGSINTNLILSVNDSIGTYTIPMSSQTVYATYSLSTSSLNFSSNVPVGTSPTLTFTITNTHSQANLLINNIIVNDSTISVISDNNKILPGNYATFTVTFLPISAKPINTTIQIAANILSLITISVQGTGLLVPYLKLSATTIDFGVYSVNTQIIKTITLQNIGLIDLQINSIQLPTIVNSTITLSKFAPFIIPANSSVSLDISIISTNDILVSGNITIQSNSITSPNVITLTGSAKSPIIKVNVDQLDFGTIYVNSTKSLMFTVMNVSDIDLNVTITPSPHVNISNTSFIVGSNSSLDITASFTSAALGNVSENVVISSNDVNHPVINVPVIGSAITLPISTVTESISVLAAVEESPSTIEFLYPVPNSLENNYLSKDIIVTNDLTLINKCFVQVTIDSVSFISSSESTASYNITIEGLPITLDVGAAITLSVKFLATSIGYFSGYLKFNARTGENLSESITSTIRYSGQAYTPEINVLPMSIDFNAVVIGTTEYQSIVITNNSTGSDLTVSLSSNNPVFQFKLASSINLTVSNGKIIVPATDIVLQSVSLTDNISGLSLVLGDPTNVNEFSINTSTGIVSVNPVHEGKSFQVQYDAKQSSQNFTISKLGSKTIDIGFSPKSILNENGIIIINSNDSDNPITNVTVTGSGLSALTTIQYENSMSKFEVKVDDTQVKRCVLKNTGSSKLFVSNVTVGSSFSVGSTQFEIDPNETYSLSVIFSPVSASIENTNLVITSNAPLLTIPIQGEGTVPILSVPNTVAFGNSAIENDKKIPLIFSNTGKAQMNVELNVVSDVFSISPSVFAVEPNGEYEISVIFHPITTQPYIGKLKVVTDDPSNKQTVINLTGTGILKPVIQVPNKLEFSRTNVRETGQLILVVSNSGSDVLHIATMTVVENSREFSLQFTPTSIAPKTSRNYAVKFVPSSTGVKIGKIKIACDDVDNPQVEILLKGEGFQPKGEWQSFNLKDLMPEPVMSVANGVNNVITPLKTILGLIKQILNLVKIFLVDTDSVLAAVLKKVQTVINDYVNDLASTGIYMLPLFPRKNYYDPNVIADTGFSKFLASIGGGSVMFKKRIVDSFDDTFDGLRPQFSSSSKVGAIVLAVDSGNIADIVSGVRALSNIFTSINIEPEIQPPTRVEAIADDNKITLRWELPEIFTFSIGGIFSQQKTIELISGFKVYKSEQPSSLVVADADILDSDKKHVIIHKGEVYNINSNEVVQPKDISKESFSYLFSNFAVGWKNTNTTVRSLGFQMVDTGLTNGKTYYYVVRTKMGTDNLSPLSNEASACPNKIDVPQENAFLNRCANFQCALKKSVTQDIKILGEPIVKLIDKTGEIQQNSLQTQKDKIITNASNQQVNTFSIIIRNTKIDASKIVIRNVTITSNRIKLNNLDVDTKRFFDESSKKIVDWDNSATDCDQQKTIYFDYLNKTKLILGYDFILSKDRENSIITINDISNIGYSKSDIIVIEYNEIDYEPKCSQGFVQKNTSDIDARFDPVACGNGAIKGYCDKYVNKHCIYHGGTSCLNTGYTYKGEGRCVQNSILFNSLRCIDGSMCGDVSYFDKSFRNDPNSCLKTTGVCAGYTSVDESSVGMYPNWTSFSAKSLVKPIEDFIEQLNNWVNREIDAVQKGTSSVAEFIELLAKKIEALEEFIDQLQRIVDIFQAIFSANAGFHILKINVDSGGVERIKSIIQTANGGPDSGSNGYTAGVVLLIGGPEFDKAWQFLKLLF